MPQNKKRVRGKARKTTTETKGEDRSLNPKDRYQISFGVLARYLKDGRCVETRSSSAPIIVFMTLCMVSFVTCSSSTLMEIIQKKEAYCLELADASRAAFDNRCGLTTDCTCSSHYVRSSFPDGTCRTEYDARAGCACNGMAQDYTASVVRLPKESATLTKDEKESICFSGYEADDLIHWQGLGTWNGMFRTYPGKAKKKYGYDPRLRPWYVAAASGPKDVVIIIDKSGSMDGALWSIATEAVETVLDTLTMADFVSVITFSVNAGTVGFGPMVRAKSANLDKIKEALKEESPDGGTNFEAAFAKAFDVLDASLSTDTSNCHKSILFLTDGEITQGGSKFVVMDLIETRNAVHDAMIFTFSLGNGADRIVPKEIACGSSGLWQAVAATDDLRSQMSLFYEFYSTGMAIADPGNRAVWVEPYLYSTDNKLGTSVSVPVYSYSTDPPLQIGVASTGFLMESMYEIESDPDSVLDALLLRSTYCPEFSLTTCQLESLRARVSYESQCTTVPNCTLDSMLPKTCEERVYPSDAEMWCNIEDKPFSSRACCSCPFPPKVAGAVFGTAGGVAVVVVIAVVVLVVVYVLYRRKNSVQEEKSNIGRRASPVVEPQVARELEAPQGGQNNEIDGAMLYAPHSSAPPADVVPMTNPEYSVY